MTEVVFDVEMDVPVFCEGNVLPKFLFWEIGFGNNLEYDLKGTSHFLRKTIMKHRIHGNGRFSKIILMISP